MKKEYDAPEFELNIFSFESILADNLNVSDPETGGSSHTDDDDDEW